MLRRSPIAWFLAVAFGWSWALWGLSAWLDLGGPLGEIVTIGGRFGPTVSAVGIAAVLTGRNGIEQLIRAIRRWHAPARLWLIALLGPVVVVLAAIATASFLGTPAGEFNDPASAYLVLPAFVAILVLGGPLGEEVGWRGYALDPLQARLGPVFASLALGVVWGLWHLPLFFDPGTVQQALPPALYLGQTTSTAVIYTWLWNRTGSLPVVLTLHTMTNLAAGVFPFLRPDSPSDLPFAVAVAMAGCLALALVVSTHGRLGWGSVTSGDDVRRRP